MKPITRVDLEAIPANPGHVLVKKWFEGWQQNTPAHMMDYEIDTSVQRLLARYEAEGFTVEMMNAFTGRALKGQITRIDFTQQDGEWLVRKYCYGWTAKTRPIEEKSMPDIAEALEWCKAHRWTVYEWPGGARAWKGKPMPVRDRASIQTLRRQTNTSIRGGYSDPRFNYDLAFYF